MRRLVISTASDVDSQDWVSTPVKVVCKIHVSMSHTCEAIPLQSATKRGRLPFGLHERLKGLNVLKASLV